jgi:hypothetical protein
MSEHLEAILHENGIHELIFHSEHRQVVDEYFAWIEATVLKLAETSDTVNIRLLLNFVHARDLPPFTYLTSQGRKLLSHHSQDLAKLHIRGAFLARQDEMLVLSLIETFFKILPIDAKMKPFPVNEREKAIAWLLE